MPAKWYSIELPSAEVPLVKMIVLDGNYWPGALAPKEKLDQRRFLKAELEKPTDARWTWVVNHFPIFSECVKRGDNASLLRDWGPIIKDHPVSLCLAGHDHTMQHLRVDGYSPSFIVSGAGGAGLYEVKKSERGFADDKQLGFTHIYVTPDELQLQFIDTAGNCVHHFRRDRAGNVAVLS
jgi:hypothetical protein